MEAKKHTYEIQLKEFPSDVQELLKKRAIKNCRPVEAEIKEFSLETARRINNHNKDAA